MSEIREMHFEVQCPECYGNGFQQVGPECSRPASTCCGGCYREVSCDHHLCVDGYVTVTLDEETTIEVVTHLIQNEIEEARELIHEQHHGVCQR